MAGRVFYVELAYVLCLALSNVFGVYEKGVSRAPSRQKNAIRVRSAREKDQAARRSNKELNRFSHRLTYERYPDERAFYGVTGQGLPLAKIGAEIGVSTTTLINWDWDLKEEIDNPKAVELEALYDKFYLSTRK